MSSFYLLTKEIFVHQGFSIIKLTALVINNHGYITYMDEKPEKNTPEYFEKKLKEIFLWFWEF